MSKSTFTVQLIKLRNFPTDCNKVDCFATFAYETQSLCGIAVPGTEVHLPNNNRILTWNLDKNALSDLKSIGVSACKLSFCNTSGRRIGWMVLDLRNARSNSKKLRDEGIWLPLSGLSKDATTMPEVFVKYELASDEQQQESAHSCPSSPSRGVQTAGNNVYGGGRLAAVKNVLHSLGLDSTSAVGSPRDRDIKLPFQGGGAAPRIATANENKEPNMKVLRVLAEAKNGLSRDPLEVCTSRLTPKAPRESASQSGGGSARQPEPPPNEAPSSKPEPAADPEPSLQPQQPSTSLAPTPLPSSSTQSATGFNPFMNGFHLASMPAPSTSAVATDQAAGLTPPVLPSFPGMMSQPMFAPPVLSQAFPFLNLPFSSGLPGASMPMSNAGPEASGAAAAAQFGMLPSMMMGMGMIPGMYNSQMMMPNGADVRTAWELERWREREEARFKEDMDRKVARRLEELQEEWRQKEERRRAEHAEVCSKYASLEEKARQVISNLHNREAKLKDVEVELDSKRLEIERQHDKLLLEAERKISLAEAAMDRLKMDCSNQLEADRSSSAQQLEAERSRSAQQLETERQKNVELTRSKSALESRCAELEQRCAQLEQMMQGLRETYDNTPESQLRQQIDSLKSALTKAESKSKKATHTRDKYKQQIVRMGHDIGALQRALQSQLSVLLSQQTNAAAGTPGAVSEKQLKQLQDIKSTLVNLQASSLTAPTTQPTANNDEPKAKLKQVGADGNPQLKELQRLINEREALLESGTYKKEDKLITELDNLIMRMFGS